MSNNKRPVIDDWAILDAGEECPQPDDVPPGWWILPAAVLGAIFWGAAIWWAL